MSAEIIVIYGGTAIIEDGAGSIGFPRIVFDPVFNGSVPSYRTFVVRNDGSSDLTLSNLVVPAGFTIFEGLTATLAPLESDSFTVRLDTAIVGKKVGDIVFFTNDFDENPFNFGISGSVVTPNIFGSAADDMLQGNVGQEEDRFAGGLGNDIYVINTPSDMVLEHANEGMDTAVSSIPWILPEGVENLSLIGNSTYWGAGNDLDNIIIGSDFSNWVLRGAGGADTIFGGGGNDWIEGETGNDIFGGVPGNDTLHGEAGDDTVLAGEGDDVAYGGSGTDFLIGEMGNDLMYGGSEWDAIDGRQGSDVLYGDGGADIIFGDGYYYLFGFSNDSLFGGEDNDIMMGEAGESSLDGAGDALYGEGGNDLLDGGGGNDAIFGGDGNDVIDGDHGNDYIVGGLGAETMLGSNAVNYGGPTQGSDLFVYMSMADAGDFIYGFDTRAGESDGIDLRSLFDALGYAGTTPRAAGTNILSVVDSGGNALVMIDPDGAPGAQAFSTLVTLVGVNAGAVTDGFFLFQ